MTPTRLANGRDGRNAIRYRESTRWCAGLHTVAVARATRTNKEFATANREHCRRRRRRHERETERDDMIRRVSPTGGVRVHCLPFASDGVARTTFSRHPIGLRRLPPNSRASSATLRARRTGFTLARPATVYIFFLRPVASGTFLTVSPFERSRTRTAIVDL